VKHILHFPNVWKKCWLFWIGSFFSEIWSSCYAAHTSVSRFPMKPNSFVTLADPQGGKWVRSRKKMILNIAVLICRRNKTVRGWREMPPSIFLGPKFLQGTQGEEIIGLQTMYIYLHLCIIFFNIRNKYIFLNSLRPTIAIFWIPTKTIYLPYVSLLTRGTLHVGRVARFFLVQTYQNVKNYQITTNCSKRP
jgi:hypothetical protein